MDDSKKQIRKACKAAASYHAWRNPMGVWFVTLFDSEDKGTLEFQFSEDFPSREKAWAWKLLEEIDQRNKK